MSRFVPLASSNDNHNDNDDQLEKAYRYDMFLSFSGKNNRKKFTDHLLKKLKEKGYRPFHDSMLTRGEYIDSELLKAIQDSRMSIVLFSKNYADSRWCLDELVKIMECKKSFQQIVLPVFLDVEPSDIRKQQGLFAKAFKDHEKSMSKNRVEIWRKALKDAGTLSGLHLQNDANGYESELLDKIIKEVEKHLRNQYLNVAYHPVGIESRVAEITELLQMERSDVQIVAIWGVGGLGKTTISKATYNCLFFEFESRSFLEDIKDSDITTLQNKLLQDLMTDKAPRINNGYRATEEIKRILACRRVLIVLDDINDFGQLERLAINRRFFYPGSRIIITTRDIASVGSLKVDAVYSPKALNELESMQLFSLYAFGEDCPLKGYGKLTKELVQYAGGIPLVLQIIGSFSSNLTKSQWQDNIKKLRRIPNNDVQGKLKVSYDSLGYEEKELFLNICCFFIGMEKDLMVKVMEDSNCFPKVGIKMLTDRALVNIDDGVLLMHNLIRDMGREIVRQESLKEPGRRSRLWDHDDISEVFQQCSGTSAVESIIHGNLNTFITLDTVNTEAFGNMTNLKLLLLHHVCLFGTFDQMHYFKKLKYMHWHGFPMACMPSNLIMKDLVVMDMQYSKLKILWNKTMNLSKLRFLNLSDSCFLTTTPDFSEMKNLEKLLLARCPKLIELHCSVTCLNKLRILDLSYCTRLKRAPDITCILKLKSLEELYIYHCPKLKSNTSATCSMKGSVLTKLSLVQCNLVPVPSEIGKLESLITLELHENKFSTLPDLKNLHHLKELTLSDCVKLQSIPDLPKNIVMIIAVNCSSLKGLPSNISELHCLDELRLSFCKKLGSEDPQCLVKLSNLRSLSFLEMDYCNVAHVPSQIGNLVSLDFLNLSRNTFSSLPPSFSNLHRLSDLHLLDCIELQTVPVLPRNLKSCKATNCRRLINLPSNISELKFLRELQLDNCSKLEDKDPLYFGKLDRLSSLVNLNMKNCSLSHIPSEIERLVSLSRLDLSENIFSTLPDSLSKLQNLKEMELNRCALLKSFPVLPPAFTVLKADYCTSLQMIPFKPFFLHCSGQELRFSHCPASVGNNYARNFKKYILQFHHELFHFQQAWPIIPEIRVSLTGTTIPDWCTYQGRGKFLSFVVPMDASKKFIGWIYCAIAPNCKDDECRLKCRVVNKSKERADYIGTTLCGYGPMFIAFVPHLIDLIPRLTFMVEGGDELVLGFELECKHNWEVEKCGMCLIYEGDDSSPEPNTQSIIEYTPYDLSHHLHQMVYEAKWEEFREIYLLYMNSKADDDSDDGEDAHDGDDGEDAHDGEDGEDDHDGDGDEGGGVSWDTASGDSYDYYHPWSYNVVTDGGPWFRLRPEELGDWLHDP